MDFDFQWVLLGLPVAFALGWMASRLDLRQWKRDQRDSPKAYFKGLNFLLNEQQDKAIDAFIEAVQQDPDTSDLHFARPAALPGGGDDGDAVSGALKLFGQPEQVCGGIVGQRPEAGRDEGQTHDDLLKRGTTGVPPRRRWSLVTCHWSLDVCESMSEGSRAARNGRLR